MAKNMCISNRPAHCLHRSEAVLCYLLLLACFSGAAAAAGPEQNTCKAGPVGFPGGARAGAAGTSFANWGAFAVLKADTSISVWGNSGYGGSNGPTDKGYIAVYSTGSAFAAVKADGAISVWGNSRAGGSNGPTDKGYVAVYSTKSAFAAVKTDGSIFVWGYSGGGGGPTDKGYVAVYSNEGAFAAVKADGTISVWGNSDYGGRNGPTDKGYVAVYSTQEAFAAVKADGSIYTWGTTDYYGGSALVGPTDKGYGAVYSTHQAFAAVKADGSISVWGNSWYGGTNGPTDKGYVAVYSASNAFAAVKADGSISVWGRSGQGGSVWGSHSNGGSNGPTDKGYVAVYSTEFVFAAVKADGSIFMWGQTSNNMRENFGGGYSDDDGDFIDAPQDKGYVAVYSTRLAFAAVKNDGSIFVWGGSNYGGSNGPTDKGYVAVYSTWGAFAAVKADGTTFAWGLSDGTGNYGGGNAPASVSTGATFAGPSYDGSQATRCTLFTDDCLPKPCQNGGTCTDKVNSYTCTCKPGWSGTTCTTNIDDCGESGAGTYDNGAGGTFRTTQTSLSNQQIALAACESYAGGGQCKIGSCGHFNYYFRTNDNFHCNHSREKGYEWIYSNTGYVTVGQDYSYTGSADVSGDSLFVRYKPSTTAAWVLALKELGDKRVDANNPCKNGATCADKVNGYTCTCKPGYSGMTCSTNIDDCAAASDKNENCPIWAARNVPESECANNPTYMLGNFNPGKGNCLKSCRSCNNNGKCVDGVGKFTCACNPGYSGAYCEANIDECLPKPCQNGGTCTDLVNGYKCACKPGWSGSTCAININECAPKPCKNGAPCGDLVNGYKCACKPGWSGSTCATNINDCANNPCKNGASCSDLVNGYKCACKPGWSGSTCAININECATTPCQNGGTCADKVNGYTCACKPGYSGSTCSVTTTITTTSATTTTYQPQMCHAVLEAAGCGSRIPIADCSVGGVHQEFAEVHCPVMCGLECTSTVTSTTTVPSTMTTTATSTPITTPTTTTTTTTTITTSTTTSGTTSSATSTTYQPQFCNGVPEVAGCGSRIPTADCSIGGVHQEFAEAQCPAMCGLECTSTVTSTTTATISSTTTLTSTTSTVWLGIHDLCDPLNDVCNQTQGLVCDHAVYTCRYRTTTSTATATAALTTTAYADDEQAAPTSASGDSGGSTNVGLYSCIGALTVLVGIVAIWRRGGRSAPVEVPMPNKRRIAGANNPMYKETHEAVGSTIKKDPPSAADAGMYESSYEEMGPGSEASNSRTVGNAAYEEVLRSLDNYDAHSNGNDNATYEEVVGNEDVFDSDDMEC